MNTSNYSRSELLEMCRMYGIKVTGGNGRITICGQEFDVKELFENTFPTSVTSLSLFSFTMSNEGIRVDIPKQMNNAKSFSVELSTLFAA